MQIKDLKPKTGNVDIVVEVIEKSDPREFTKFGNEGKVCNAQVKDETGETILTLWNDDADKIKVGDKVHIENGWVGEWQGEIQLSAGRFGKLEVVGDEAASKDKDDSAEKPSSDDDVEEEQVE